MAQRYDEGLTGTITKETLYYYQGGKLVALKQGSTLSYVAQDHLTGTALTTDTSGNVVDQIKYAPYGTTRSGDIASTEKKFTGQRLDGTGLYFYNARYYDPALGRFISADTVVQTAPLPFGQVIGALTVSYSQPRRLAELDRLDGTTPNVLVPNPAAGSYQVDPQELNRYGYTLNNPLKYTDPEGSQFLVGLVVGGLIGLGAYAITHQGDFDWREAAYWTAGGAIIGGTLGAAAPTVAAALGPGAIASAAGAQRGLTSFWRAADYGIKAARVLAQQIRGTGLQTHHLVEVRFEKVLGQAGIEVGDSPAIALTPEEHQVFTNAWRDTIGYINGRNPLNTANATLDDIWEAAQRIYQDYPEVLDAVKQFLGK